MKSSAAFGIPAVLVLAIAPISIHAAPLSFPVSLLRPQWFWSSLPLYDTADSLQPPISYLVAAHCRIEWYNPRGVFESDLNPALTPVEGGQNEHTVLELSVLPPTGQAGVEANDWSGITQCLSNVGEDFSDLRYMEVWVNDFTGDHTQTDGKLHFDLGVVSEDAFWDANNPPNGRLDTEDKNGDGKLDRSTDLSIDEDTGLDGLHDSEEPGYDPVTNPDPDHDDYHFVTDQTPPDYSAINNQEGNGTGDPNAKPDTEDLNHDGYFRYTHNDYFEATLRLSDSTFVMIDVPKDYAGDPDVKEGNGWRLFRIPLTDEGFRRVNAANWEDIQYLRIWANGMSHPMKVQIGGIAFLDSLGRALPSAVHLRQNHPNPFNPGTTIPFELSEFTHVILKIFDTRGRLVRVLVDGALPRGYHAAVWDGKDSIGRAVSSGVYWCRLETGGVAETRTMVLVR